MHKINQNYINYKDKQNKDITCEKQIYKKKFQRSRDLHVL